MELRDRPLSVQQMRLMLDDMLACRTRILDGADAELRGVEATIEWLAARLGPDAGVRVATHTAPSESVLR